MSGCGQGHELKKKVKVRLRFPVLAPSISENTGIHSQIKTSSEYCYFAIIQSFVSVRTYSPIQTLDSLIKLLPCAG